LLELEPRSTQAHVRSPALTLWLARRSAPETLGATLPLLVIVLWAAMQGGFPATTWYPGALFLLALLAVTAACARWRWDALSRPARMALWALGAYTAWSYLTIAWAGVPGTAWDGANRTLLYFVIFALFAIPSARGRAAWLLGSWAMALIVLAATVLLRLPHAIGSVPVVLGQGLTSPVGYVNAEAALWLMALWPALVLASSRSLPAWLRGIFAAGAVVLVDTAALAESRGSVLSAGVLLILFFCLVPDRVGHLLRMLPIGIAVAITLPHALHVSNAIERDYRSLGELGTVAKPVLLAALLAGIVVAACAAAAPASRLRLRQDARDRLRRGFGTAAIISVLAACLVLMAQTRGGPVGAIERGWHAFVQSPTAPTQVRSHLATGVGGARYDYYRVALDVFAQHPLLGIGADNFAEDYLARGRAHESPTYPHSLELQTLAGTGLVGSMLLLVAIAAALGVAVRAIRRAAGADRALAAGALMVFLYWFVHGSFDWLWEFPALGGAAFAMLGLAGSLAPRHPRSPGAARRRLTAPATRRRPIAPARRLALATVAAVAFVALLAPWLANLEIGRASAEWLRSPTSAIRELHTAAHLNPLSERPQLIEGSIDLRLGLIADARRSFIGALARDPRNAYATLELGAIAADAGQLQRARMLLARALALNPGDAVTKAALAELQTRHRIALNDLDRQIADQSVVGQR